VILSRIEDFFVGKFTAMAGPCEVLVDTDDSREAESAAGVAENEARRIERKFSRYLPDNPVHRVNHAQGRPVEVDEETALLLDYAAACHDASGGMFDITSGILRRAWSFDGGTSVPSEETLQGLLPLVGWHRVSWKNRVLAMPPGMEIDLGGIGKEYAVDRAAALLRAGTRSPFLVNFGGDLAASGWRRDQRPWRIGVEDPDQPEAGAAYHLEVDRGGIATSGDARRFVTWKGRRLGHILDPRTGWPVEGAPRSVTVLGDSCMEAGSLSTIAYLQGSRAREFLREQGVHFWIV
jgi:FAD:protein FMN transferase